MDSKTWKIVSLCIFVNISSVTPQTGVCEFGCDNGQCVLATDRCNGVQDCTDGSDEDSCTGSLRLLAVTDFLASGNSVAGRLELHDGSVWRSFCNDTSFFDFFEADLACKELGYLYFKRIGSTIYSGAYHYGSLSCSTSLSSQLRTCSRTAVSSCRTNDVALECTDDVSPMRLRSFTGRTANLSAGRLEIFINGEWGTVCDDFFSASDADVACKQLGFTSSTSYITTRLLNYPVVSTSVPIWLDDVDCSGRPGTKNLRLCDHRGVGVENCIHSEDVFLSCAKTGSVRLRDGTSTRTNRFQFAGRLEVNWRNSWGTVCYDPDFSLAAAEIVCQQMGLLNVIGYGSARLLGYSSSLSANPGRLLSGVNCSIADVASTGTILDCDHDGLGMVDPQCSNLDSVGIRCGLPPAPTTATTTDSRSFGTSVGYSSGLVSVFVAVTVVMCCVLYQKKRKRTTTTRQWTAPPAPPPATSSVSSCHIIQDSSRMTSTTFDLQPLPPAAREPGKPAEPEPSSYKNSEIMEAPPPSYEAAMQYPTVMSK